MKKLLLLAFIASTVLFAKAQGPQQINYQGVARNSVGSIIANQNISLRLSVRDASANGPVVYSESRNLKTMASSVSKTKSAPNFAKTYR